MPETATTDQLLTLGQIAQRLDVPQHRLKYALEQHEIAPASRVGILRLWRETDIPQIREALAQVAANRRRPRPETNELFTDAELAERLGVGIDLIRDLALQGLIHGRTVAGVMVFVVGDVERALNLPRLSDLKRRSFGVEYA